MREARAAPRRQGQRARHLELPDADFGQEFSFDFPTETHARNDGLHRSREGKVETARHFLRDDGNLNLCGFAFDWNGLFRLLQALDVTADGVRGHDSRVLQVLAFRHKPGRVGTVAVFVGLEKSGVFARLPSGSFHLFILD
jgi:hypothetical protein